MDESSSGYQITFRLTWDKSVDAGYLSLDEGVNRPRVGRTIPIIDRASQAYGALDLSEEGELLGIEILGVSRMLRRHIIEDQGGDSGEP